MFKLYTLYSHHFFSFLGRLFVLGVNGLNQRMTPNLSLLFAQYTVMQVFPFKSICKSSMKSTGKDIANHVFGNSSKMYCGAILRKT